MAARTNTTKGSIRRLVLIFGDQLDRGYPVWETLSPKQDAVWMAEVDEESTIVQSHKIRTALFLSAMRHFEQWLASKGFRVFYTRLNDRQNRKSLQDQLVSDLAKLQPDEVFFYEPGEYRVCDTITKALKQSGIPFVMREDPSFLCTHDMFAGFLENRKQPRMDHFYRWMRKEYGILYNQGRPAGGKWNYDASNRKSFSKTGPNRIPPPVSFAPDDITLDVLNLVNKCFPDHPGDISTFCWPVTREGALKALNHFIDNCLPNFGTFQDAMWAGEPFLYHSLLSSSLNLKLLSPLEVIRAAETAWNEGHAPIESCEGFVRQILGWREYTRGIYFDDMPEYIKRNTLNASAPLPSFFWTAQTDMNCLRETIQQTLRLGYAHHIQRLMITGLYCLLFGVHPQAVHEWYLAVYLDAVEWVELPNTLGMSQFADDGQMASKPYCASGKYINRMSNYCHACRYDPNQTCGDKACPFTVMYWDFLATHERSLSSNPRMGLSLKNLKRFSNSEIEMITKQAKHHRQSIVS